MNTYNGPIQDAVADAPFDVHLVKGNYGGWFINSIRDYEYKFTILCVLLVIVSTLILHPVLQTIALMSVNLKCL